MRFDHVGVATRDAADLADLFDGLLDAPVAHEEMFDGMSVVFPEPDDGGYFELLELTAGGAIAGYLDREGPGIHHVALATDDIAWLRSTAPAIRDRPPTRSRVPGRGATEVAFLHPRSTGGVLVEFVEHRRRPTSGDGDRFNRTAS